MGILLFPFKIMGALIHFIFAFLFTIFGAIFSLGMGLFIILMIGLGFFFLITPLFPMGIGLLILALIFIVIF